jgi:hypothetical protein
VRCHSPSLTLPADAGAPKAACRLPCVSLFPPRCPSRGILVISYSHVVGHPCSSGVLCDEVFEWIIPTQPRSHRLEGALRSGHAFLTSTHRLKCVAIGSCLSTSRIMNAIPWMNLFRSRGRNSLGCTLASYFYITFGFTCFWSRLSRRCPASLAHGQVEDLCYS